MAKLSARNRTQLARVWKTVLHPTDPKIAATVTYYALMSDKKILYRTVTRWRDHKPTDRGWRVSDAHLSGNYTKQGFLEYFAGYGYEEYK